MVLDRTWKRAGALVALAAALVVVGCGGDDDDGAASGGEKVTLSFLVDNSDQAVKPAEALIKAFQAKNPNITIKLETRPQGGEGDNVVKTRLSTQEMTDLFAYNSGSLFQALNPASQLTPLNDEPWVGDLDDAFKPSVSAEDQVYGAPFGSAFGGGILYNKKVYADLGLEVPQTWDEFMANNAKIKKAGIDPVDPELRRHVDLAAVRARRLPQRGGGGPGLGPAVHEQPGQVLAGAGRSRASSTSRRSARRAT